MDVNDLESCPRCKGTGAAPVQIPKPTSDGRVSADECRQCRGSGRIPIPPKKPRGSL